MSDSISPSASESPSSSVSVSVSPSVSKSASPSTSPSSSVSRSTSPSVSRSASPSLSPSSSVSRSESPSTSPSSSASPSVSSSTSPSVSKSTSASQSPSPSESHSGSVSPSRSVSPSHSPSGSASPSRSASPSATASPSRSSSPSRSPSGSASPSASASPSLEFGLQHVFKLTNGTDTADFLTGSLALAVDGYSNTDAADDEGYIWETIRLVNPSNTTTSAEIRTAKKNIDRLLELARQYAKSNLEPNPVWLYWQSEGEDPKRALVVDGSSEIIGSEFDSPLLGDYGIELLVAIKRYKYWESEEPITWTNAGMTESDKEEDEDFGTAPMRIASLSIQSNDAFSIHKAWIGYRPVYKGTSGFKPIWEAEYGTDSPIHNSYVTNDSTASNGQCIYITFSAYTGMYSRFSITPEQVHSYDTNISYEDFAGRYLVLARMAVDASDTECAVQLRQTGNKIVETTYINAAADPSPDNWRLFVLGEVQIPTFGNRDSVGTTGDYLKTCGFTVYAERLSNAGTLKIDYLQLIPSEHLVVIDGSLSDTVKIYTAPDNYQYALEVQNGSFQFDITSSFHDWFYPVGGGMKVIAVQSSENNHILDLSYRLELELYKRWISYLA